MDRRWLTNKSDRVCSVQLNQIVSSLTIDIDGEITRSTEIASVAFTSKTDSKNLTKQMNVIIKYICMLVVLAFYEK